MRKPPPAPSIHWLQTIAVVWPFGAVGHAVRTLTSWVDSGFEHLFLNPLDICPGVELLVRGVIYCARHRATAELLPEPLCCLARLSPSSPTLGDSDGAHPGDHLAGVGTCSFTVKADEDGPCGTAGGLSVFLGEILFQSLSHFKIELWVFSVI